MTWLLVRIAPVEVSTMPVPAAVPPWKPRIEFTSTTEGSTAAAIAAAVRALGGEAAACGEGAVGGGGGWREGGEPGGGGWADRAARGGPRRGERGASALLQRRVHGGSWCPLLRACPRPGPCQGWGRQNPRSSIAPAKNGK